MAALVAAAAWGSVALAQSYPPGPPSAYPADPRLAPPGYPPYPQSSYGAPQAAEDDDDAAPLPPQANALPQGPILSPDDPRYAGRVPQGQMAPGQARGPVLSPNDPRYGQPMSPPVVYSDRVPQGAPADGNGMRPPQGIGQQAATDPNAPPTTGTTDARDNAAMSILPPEDRPETGPFKLAPNLRRQEVAFATKEPAGTIVVDTPNTYLYYVLGNGRAMRYGVRVGREGFTWTGVQKITRKAEWPDWHPPPEMIERQPYLPRFMAGGDGNPLGARAMYLGATVYRIHGTNQPSTIGKFVSSGCVGMLNEDVMDLFERVKVGTRVVVMPGNPPPAVASAAPPPGQAPQGAQQSLPPQAGPGQPAGAPQGYRGDSRTDATAVQPLPPPTTIR